MEMYVEKIATFRLEVCKITEVQMRIMTNYNLQQSAVTKSQFTDSSVLYQPVQVEMLGFRMRSTGKQHYPE